MTLLGGIIGNGVVKDVGEILMSGGIVAVFGKVGTERITDTVSACCTAVEMLAVDCWPGETLEIDAEGVFVATCVCWEGVVDCCARVCDCSTGEGDASETSVGVDGESGSKAGFVRS